MSDTLLGVIIGGSIALLTSLAGQIGSYIIQRLNWRRDRKAEALSNVLKWAYKIKNKGSKVIYDKPKGKFMSNQDIQELFGESAELKYWMSISEVLVSKNNKKKLSELRNKMDESLIPFHNFVSEKNTEYEFDENFDKEVLSRVIEVANNEL